MEFKKIGSNLDINGMVIHRLNKIAGDRSVGFKKAQGPLVIGDKEKIFIGKLNESYRRKSNPTYGIFAGINPAFKDLLDAYLNTGDLLGFTILAAEEYKKVLSNTISATGGFLIFVDFLHKDNNNRYMLVLTINNKDGYVVSEADLTLHDIKNLELSQVDVACMINLTQWKEVEAGEDTESKTYLSFVRGVKNVSFYFQTFIDCDNKTTSTESSKRLVNAIEAYAKVKGLDRQTKVLLKNRIHDYCTECMKQKREIQLSAISAIVDPENTSEFQEFAASEDYGVSETIKGDSSQLKRIKYIMYKDDRYSVEFDASLFGKEVIYNKQKNELTFKQVPDALVKLLPS